MPIQNAQVPTMLGPACLLPRRLRFLALCLILPAFLTHCGSFKQQSRKARDVAAIVKEPSDDKASESSEEAPPEDSKKEEEDPEIAKNQRVIAVDQTPFFRWLRSGLRSNAKPSRFLKKGDLVELLKENDEEKFSRIRLADRKKGWVPSRLLKEPPAESEPLETPDPNATEEAAGQTETPQPEPLSPAGPAQLPTDPDNAQPSLKSDELGEPLFPGIDIIPPKRQPKEKPLKAAETEPKPSNTDVLPPTTPEMPPSN